MSCGSAGDTDFSKEARDSGHNDKPCKRKSGPRVTAYRISACTALDAGDRPEQQDRVQILPSKLASGTLLAVLADGMGGRTGGAMAAEQVMITSKQLFERFNPRVESVQDFVQEFVHEAHTVIRLNALSSEQEPHSTAVALLLQPNRADWFHVGDSRLYHFRGRKLLDRTVDHSYVNQLIREGRMAPAEAKSHRLANVLTQALGTAASPIPGLEGTSDLQVGDSFLLCSDGLWAYFEPDEIGQIIEQAASARDAASSLLTRARERGRGKGDNISIALVRLDPLPSPSQ